MTPFGAVTWLSPPHRLHHPRLCRQRRHPRWPKSPARPASRSPPRHGCSTTPPGSASTRTNASAPPRAACDTCGSGRTSTHSRTSLGSVAAVIHAEHRRLFGDAFFPRLITAAAAELAHPRRAAAGHQRDRGEPADGRALPARRPRRRGHRRLRPRSAPARRVVADARIPGRGRRPVVAAVAGALHRRRQPGAARCTPSTTCSSRGRRSVAHIAGPPDMVAGADRLAGYREAMLAAGVTDLPVAYGDWSQASGVHAMERLLDQRPRLDAVFVASDAMAAGALAGAGAGRPPGAR